MEEDLIFYHFLLIMLVTFDVIRSKRLLLPLCTYQGWPLYLVVSAIPGTNQNFNIIFCPSEHCNIVYKVELVQARSRILGNKLGQSCAKPRFSQATQLDWVSTLSLANKFG